MTQEKNKDQNRKKTLGLGGSKLGIASQESPINFTLKAGISYSQVQTRHNSKNNTVMIVTKNKGARIGPASGLKKNFPGSLTDKEREERINALRTAERKKKGAADVVHEAELTAVSMQEERSQVTIASESINAIPEKQVVEGYTMQGQLKAGIEASSDGSKEPRGIIVAGELEAIAHDVSPVLENHMLEAPEESKETTSSHISEERSKEIRLLVNSKGKVRNLNALNALNRSAHILAAEVAEAGAAASAKNEVTPSKEAAGSGVYKRKSDKADKVIISEAEVEKSVLAKKSAMLIKRPNRKFSAAEIRTLGHDDEDLELSGSRGSHFKRTKGKTKKQFKSQLAEKVLREVLIPDVITVQELANRMAEKAADVVKALMKLGVMITVNKAIDADTAELLVTEFGHTPKRVTDAELEKAIIADITNDEGGLEVRAPIVTVMGHVDHGKTSLLDALRCTNVVRGEHGGITQHIGAYNVALDSGHSITFLDTPGHEAFTAMRMRGAKATDIVVLVVAADDGIKEQTVEAISHAKAAKVPIIVAINKIDKAGANPTTIKNALLMHGLIPEEMGGDTMIVEVSAKNKLGLDKLEEAVLLQAELLSLKASPNRAARGVVVEAKMDRSKGSLATLLVLNGTLKIGDIVVVSTSFGRIRALVNDKGESIASAMPAVPVEVLGLNQTPSAGDEFMVVPDEKTARELVEFRLVREKAKKSAASSPVSLDQLFTQVKQQQNNELTVIVKADVHGSIEAIVSSFMKFSSEEVKIKVIHSGVGAINESDVTLAATSNALIVGFNVRANNQARNLAKQFNVDARYYSIIYDLIDEIRAAVSGMLAPTIKEQLLGYVEIRQVFDLAKVGKVAGGYVTEGVVQRNASVRLIRDNIVIYEGMLKALKRFKDDVKEVKNGVECGLALERYDDIKRGDKLEVFLVTQEKRTI